MTVTKKEIVKTISNEIGLTQLKTKEIVQKTFDAIVDILVEEGRIELRKFGVFQVKKRAARKARNPRTGEKVDVGEKFVVKFKPGKEMEERVKAMEESKFHEGQQEPIPETPGKTGINGGSGQPIPNESFSSGANAVALLRTGSCSRAKPVSVSSVAAMAVLRKAREGGPGGLPREVRVRGGSSLTGLRSCRNRLR